MNYIVQIYAFSFWNEPRHRIKYNLNQFWSELRIDSTSEYFPYYFIVRILNQQDNLFPFIPSPDRGRKFTKKKRKGETHE